MADTNLLNVPSTGLIAGSAGAYDLVFKDGLLTSPTDETLLDALTASPDFYPIGQVQHLPVGFLERGLFGVTVVAKSAPVNKTIGTAFQAFYTVSGAPLQSITLEVKGSTGATSLGNALTTTQQIQASTAPWYEKILDAIGGVGKWLLWLLIVVAIIAAIYYLHPLVAK